MNISEHFTIQEFTNSETAKRNNFMEQFSPSPEIVHNLTLLAQRVAEPIRAKFGSFSPTVAYRCKRTNDAVGGAKVSQHLSGEAFDETFILDGKNISDKVFFWLLSSDVPFTKLIWEKGDDDMPRWLHVGYTEGAKKEIMYTKDGASYIPYYGSPLEKHHKSTGKIS